MIRYLGCRVDSLGGYDLATIHEKTIKYSGLSCLDECIDLTKFQQNLCRSSGNFSEIWSISHGMTHWHFCTEAKNNICMDKIFAETLKTSVWAHFWDLLNPPNQSEFFFKKRDLSLFLLYDL